MTCWICTYGLEGGDLAAGNVVHIEAALVLEAALGPTVADLGDAVVGAVLGLEKHDGRPVVGLVLVEAARRARRPLGQVVVNRCHGQVERVAAHDLMEMRRVAKAGIDKGVNPVYHKLGTGETQHVLRGGAVGQQRDRRGEGSPLVHVGGFSIS